MSNAAIAREVGMAPSAVLERIRKLERKQIIQGYTVQLNPVALGRGLTAFTHVRTEEAVGATDAGEELAKLSGVQEVHHTAGQDCYLVKMRVHDTNDLAILLKEFGKVATVRDTRTTIVLTTVCESNPLPLPRISDEEG